MGGARVGEDVREVGTHGGRGWDADGGCGEHGDLDIEEKEYAVGVDGCGDCGDGCWGRGS